MIKYRKGRELLDQVADDLSSYDDGGMIDYSKLYKVLRTCNATLGEKINPEKDDVLSVENYRCRIPEDFLNLNYSLVCTNKKINITPPAGFQIEYESVCDLSSRFCSPCYSEDSSACSIVQKVNEQYYEFTDVKLVQVNSKSFKHCAPQCPNFYVNSGYVIEIGDNGWITTNFESGNLYVNYVSDLQDDDGDLLILDHPLVEPYYEAAVTSKILKGIVYNKDAEVAELYKDSLRHLSNARTEAIKFISISGYTEIRDLWLSQRRRFYNKFFAPIAD